MKKIIFFSALAFIFFGSVNNSFAAAECETKYSGYCEKDGGSCGSGKTNLGYYGCPSGQFCCGSQETWAKETFPNETGGNQSSGFVNPIKPSTIEEVLKNIMSYLQLIAGTIAVIFIIIGGIMYMMSIGDKNMLERAKKTLIFAIAGLAIVVAAPYFYKEIKAIFEGGSPGSALQQILANVLKLLLSVVGFLAIISLIIGSIWMFSAVGDEEKYKLGKKTATYSIVGLIIAVAALIIVNQVIALIRG